LTDRVSDAIVVHQKQRPETHCPCCRQGMGRLHKSHFPLVLTKVI